MHTGRLQIKSLCLAWSIAISLISLPPATAQIVPDRGAPGTQRPTVLVAPNGVPLVNIQTPSAAGVSRNSYSQFDVQRNGAILNNSRSSAQTQLGGSVQGNPWLATGSARVILNEVNSSNPSLLKGHVEVAGQRAQVVIANPSGITCDGCGFINASRATMTTGTPVMNSGSLENYRVHGGTVTIDGQGMDVRNTNYADVIARAVKINAALWADYLKVTAGAAQVSIDPVTGEHQVIAPVAGTVPPPTYSLDVAYLGGMYAGHIRLIGSEHGLGVRSAGPMYAGAGDIIITADGRLENAALIRSAGNARIDTAGGISNTSTGGIEAQGNASLAAGGNIDNRGSITAQGAASLQSGQTVSNRGLINARQTTVQAAVVDNLGTGKIYGGQVSIGAGTVNNQAETVDGASQAPVIAAGERLDIGAGVINNREQALIFSGGDMAIGGSLDANRRATGQASTLNNASASIEALGAIDIAARQVNNSNEHFSTTVVTLPAQSIAEYQGAGSPNRYAAGTPGVFVYNDESEILKTPEGYFESWSLYNFNRNTSQTQVASSAPAQILSGGGMRITADKLTNDKSRIIAGGAITGTIGTLTNTEAAGERTITDSGSVTNYWRNFLRGRDDTGSNSAGYNPAPVTQAMSLAPSVYLQNAAPGDASAAGTARVNASVNTGINTGVPANSLFALAPDPAAGYLVETDPRFASYRNWLGSDYLLKALALDPASTQKRLGDGFYEQRLVREQVAQLTGRRFLDGHADDESQYQALMNNAATFAQAVKLVPGVSLTAEQVAQLTSDIVWLVEKDITLPNGQVTKALVPQLYVRVQDGDLQAGGALIAGDKINLDISGDLSNSGTIAGRRVLALTAENVRNLGGRIAAEDVSLAARTDLHNIGGAITAGNSMTLAAGRDIHVSSTTRTQGNGQGSSANPSTRTNIDRVAGLYITKGGGTLHASAGRDIKLNAAEIINAAPASAGTIAGKPAGSTTITAGNNIDIGTVTESASNRIEWDRNIRRSDSSSAEAGTSIRTQGDLRLQAGNDIKARAATLTSEGSLSAAAGNNINLIAGESRRTADEAHQHTGRSGGFASKTITTRDTLDQVSAQATTLSGKSVSVMANQDIKLTGSNVVSDQATRLIAGKDLSIAAAANTSIETHDRDEKKSGIFGSGGVGFTIGTQKQSIARQTVRTTAAASTIGSTRGDVTLQAGQSYRQAGSDVMAPAGDINIAARSVDITEARETSQTSTQQKFEQTGLTVAVTAPAITAIQTARQMSQAASNTDDSRMKALAAANVALVAKSTADAIKTGPIPTGKTNPDGTPETRDANAADKVGGIDLSISLGSARSQANSTSTNESARASNVAAGANINIAASGAAAASDLSIQGSNITAGAKTSLQADGQIKLLAARNTAEQHSTNKDSSASVGVSIGTKGMLVTASASGARGNADGADISWTNTRVDAGQQVVMSAGGDTTVKGAVVTAPKISATVGGKLAIESLQDRSQYDSKQQSLGGSIAVGVGQASGSLNASNSDINSSFASIAQQSGIKAGDGGFSISVAGNTTIAGGAITSTQKAIDAGNNRFDTKGAVAITDIANQASYNANSAAINLGTGVDPSGKLAPSGTSAGIGSDSGSAGSITQAAISGIAGNTAARTGDRDTGIQKIFDAAKVQKDIAAQTQITQTFGREAPRAAADYAARQARESRANGKSEDALKWDEGGAYRVALQTAVGGLAGGVAGAAGAVVAATAAPMLNQLQDSIAGQLKQAGAGDAAANAAAQLVTGATAAGMGAVAGGGSAVGAATGLNVDANNRALHPDETKWIKENARRFAQQLGINEQDAEKRLAQQAFRQVQYGAEGAEDGNARAFLSQAHGMLAADPTCPTCGPGYMFYGTPEQRASTGMYAGALAQTAGFYQTNGLTQPTLQQIVNAASTDSAQRNIVAQRTVLAAAASGALALAPALSGMAAEVAAFAKNPIGYCLGNPAGCSVAAEGVAYALTGVPQPVSGVPTSKVVGVATKSGTGVAGVGGNSAGQAWKGTGPIQGTIGVGPSTESVKALQNFSPSKGVEYVFDPASSTFVVGNGTMKHSALAASIGADTNQVVGGIFNRGSNGSILTNEGSGHFWKNWTPEIRQKYVDFMRSKGVNVIHTEGK